jgi:dephospho-CoA kinase
VKVIGLTGGIASGKSTAAAIFDELGIPVIDADEIARELRAPGGRARPAIQARFGTAEPARLRELVFGDATARRDLEAILHPLIVEESGKRLAEAALKRKSPVVLYEAALLVETGRHSQLDGLIVVTSPRQERVRRLVARDGATPEMAERILDAQLEDDARVRLATHVIENNGSPDALRARVAEIAEELKRAAAD